MVDIVREIDVTKDIESFAYYILLVSKKWKRFDLINKLKEQFPGKPHTEYEEILDDAFDNFFFMKRHS